MHGYRAFRRIPFLLATAGLVAACSPQVEAPKEAAVQDWHSDQLKAEYAFRLRVPQTGFDSAAATVQWLQDHAGFVNPTKEESRKVTYFAVVPPADLPDHFDASFRLRGTDDYTYKVRGPAPWPSTGWSFPACAGLKVDAEYDIAIGADGRVADTKASHGCDGNAPAAFGDAVAKAEARPCKIEMERTRLEWGTAQAGAGKSPKELKVEQWTFTSPNGAKENLVEISWKGKASQADNDRFSALVKSLPKGFPAELPLGKEKRAEACDANK